MPANVQIDVNLPVPCVSLKHLTRAGINPKKRVRSNKPTRAPIFTWSKKSMLRHKSCPFRTEVRCLTELTFNELREEPGASPTDRKTRVPPESSGAHCCYLQVYHQFLLRWPRRAKRTLRETVNHSVYSLNSL